MFIHQALDRARRLYAAREAVVCGEVRLTYAELAERVDRLAGGLAACGVASGDRVGILMHNCHRYMESYLATERAGAVLTPLNHRLAPAELTYVLNDAEATALIVGAELLPLYEACAAELKTVRVVVATAPSPPASRDEHARGRELERGVGARIVAPLSASGRGPLDYESLIARSEPMDELGRAWCEDDMVQLYYTSGTTGRPKGVMLSQRNVISNAYHSVMIHRLVERDVFIHAAPMFHLADAWACWTVSWVGARHVFLPEFSPRGFLELVQRERVTVACIVPTMINFLINFPEVASYDTSSLRLVTFGASPMPVDRLRAAMAVLRCEFSHLYGMTETSPFACQLVPEDVITEGPAERVRRLASCGREIPGVQVRVAHEDGTPVAPGEVGEIVMRGPNVMLGYWRLPEVTAETLRGGWMHSGDLATVDEEGYIFIVDRRKDMIITGGENVYSTEVESALYNHPAVLEAAVIGVPDERWGERVHAVVALKDGHQAEPGELTDFCRRFIAGYKLPRSFDFVVALPRTGSGKIQKSALREPYWQGFERRVN